MGPLTEDTRWVRQSFIVAQADLDAVDQKNRYFTTASMKFTDASLGGNFCINPPPQFTRNADLRPANKSRSKSIATGMSGGMGRYYSEAIDDHNQIVYIRCGLPAFTPIWDFLGSFYDPGAGLLARTGRAPGLFYAVGRAVGFVVSILNWKFLAVHMLSMGIKLLNQKPRSKFYYSKPTMPLYWNAVNTIVNQLAVNKGIVPRIPGTEGAHQMNSEYKFTQSDIDRLHSLFPQMFNEGGSIDVYALANRAQRLAIQHAEMQKALDKDGVDIEAGMAKIYSQYVEDKGGMSYKQYLQKWLDSEASQPKGQAAASDADLTADAKAAAGGTDAAPSSASTSSEDVGQLLDPKNPAKKFMSFLEAEWYDGGSFAGFRVESTGTVQESFSSQTAESEMQTKFNGMSSTARKMEFDFANGNILGGALGSVLGAVKDAASDVIHGAAKSLHLSGLMALADGAFVDIPKHWVSSSAQLPHSSYTIKLVSPYGNPFSQMMNIYIPLAMLMAMALPISTGKQSYTSPFLVELYDQGRCITRLGIVDSLSITRGIGNTGWNSAHQALGIEVTFSIADLSSIMAMPIQQGFDFGTAVDTAIGATQGALGGAALGTLFGPLGAVVGGAGGAAAGAANALGVFDDDNTFTDYMNILAATSLADNVYTFSRFKRNLNQKLAAFESWKSISHMASFAGDLLPSRIASAFVKGVSR